MRTIFFIATIVCASIVWSEEYANEMYGIALKAPHEWTITSSAKLKIDLKSLSDEQLPELFHAYERKGILSLQKTTDNGSVDVIVNILAANGKIVPGLQKAVSWDRSDKTRETIVPARELQLGGVTGGYLVQKMHFNRPTQFHQYIIPRSRSYLVVTAHYPIGDVDLQTKDLEKLFEGWEVDLLADQPN